jgi:hypothetical protein
MTTIVDAGGIRSAPGPVELEVNGRLTVQGTVVLEQLTKLGEAVSSLSKLVTSQAEMLADASEQMKAQRDMIENLEKKVSTAAGKSTSAKAAAKES